MSQLIETPAEDTAIATGAQSAVVPIDNEPSPRLIVEPPLPGPLAQDVVFIPYRVENMRILPAAGPARGQHKVLIELVDAEGNLFTAQTVTFHSPGKEVRP